ncbi:MAG: chemotaxis protein CheC [Oscillospiraceae bacterium]
MEKNPEKMNWVWEDMLREITNIGSGNAATALSGLLNRPISQSVPEIKLVSLSQMPKIMGGAEKIVMAGMLAISGDISGYLLMIIEPEQVKQILSAVKGNSLLSDDPIVLTQLSEMEVSILSETVNIMGGSYLSAVCELTGLKAVTSIPYLCTDMIGAVLNIAIAEVGKTGDYAVLFSSEFYNEDEKIDGKLLLIPEESSCKKIMESIGSVYGTT